MRARVCLLVPILSVIPFFQIFPQTITKRWEARYSEPGYRAEVAQRVETDASGNAFVLGATDRDALLLKYDPAGKILWTFQAGRGVFMERIFDSARAFVVDGDGNSYLVLEGYIPNTSRSSLVVVIKVDTNGKEVWRKYLDALVGMPMKLTLLSDNSIALFYRMDSYNLSVSRLAANGEVLWTTKVADSGTIQNIRILNGSIVVWYYKGTSVWNRIAYLQVYTIDGTVKWKNEYQYAGEEGTWITGICYYNNEFIVNYYIDTGGSDKFNQVFRYNASTGEMIKNFMVYLDTSIAMDSPLDVITVGNDGEIMIVEADDLEVRKYSMAGTLLWKRNFDVEYEYQVLDARVRPETSSVDVLLRTTRFNAGTTYSVTSFLPDKTSRMVASLSTARPDVLPVCFSASGSDLFIAGTFSNGEKLQDLTLTKLTTSNVHAWTTAYTPANSETHLPTCIATDARGNVYVAGMLGLKRGGNGFGVIKYDATGKQVWVKKIAPDDKMGSESSYTLAMAMAVNANQEVYITGVIDIGNMDNSSMGEVPRDLYTIKLDANGNTLWTKKAQSVTDDNFAGFQLELDSQSNVYVLAFDMNREVPARTQMVLLKYDNSGTQLWERRFGHIPDYRTLTAQSPGGKTPVLKIYHDEAYVLYNDLSDSYPYYDALNLRKFSAAGTETLLWQTITSEVYESHVQGRNLYLDAAGSLYLAYTYFFRNGGVMGNAQIRLLALKSSGEKLWEKSWTDGSGYVSNMTLAPGRDNQLYLVATTTTDFHYISITPGGDEIWHQRETLRGYNYFESRPSFVFTKENGNALFASSNLIENTSAYYFVCERDQKTGAVITTETFDEVYDSYGWLTFTRPPDMVMGACLSVDQQSLFVTGSIQDKMRESETIVTLKYSVSGSDDSDDGGDDDDDDDNDDDGNSPVTSIKPGEEHSLTAYPTLTQGVFQISGLTRECTDIQVLDAFGRHICRFDPGGESFDLTGKPTGVYLIRIEHRGRWYTSKIMKE